MGVVYMLTLDGPGCLMYYSYGSHMYLLRRFLFVPIVVINYCFGRSLLSLYPSYCRTHTPRLNYTFFFSALYFPPFPPLVCDWCRYRKIRCDRESPCNSCIHSKRECIRSPPSALIGNTPEESETSTKKTKRNRAEDKDGRRSKSYRGSSTSSQRSSSYNSYSSPGTDDEGSEASGARSSLSPVVGSLTLAGLGLSSLGLSLLDTRRNSDFSLKTSSLALGNALQDQEHLDRVRRIEMLLCNVIPGAAEFIANGTQPPAINPSNAKGDQPLSLITQGLENSAAFKDLLSPQERFANISLNSPSVTSSNKPSWLPASLPTLQEEGPPESTSQPPAFDHIERMKRIELLLSSISDMPLAKALLTHSQGSLQSDRKKSDDKRGSKVRPHPALFYFVRSPFSVTNLYFCLLNR